MNYPQLLLIAGALLIGGYFIYNSTNTSSDECNGDWTDTINPACWVSSFFTTATGELNTVLIIVGVVIVLVLALLAFGPQTGHIAHTAGALAIL